MASPYAGSAAPHADAGGLGHRERLDRPAEDLDLGLVRPHDVRLDLLSVTRGTGDAGGDLPQLGTHAAVPPTVSSATRRVG